ncbi:Uu.00g062670.m01.CDS01 [Anthostomella pinea]|uniref:Uu.00g062670.m01.CDS01 n=1 Tax=Anthostomella pinea TaxID=933095 RepID=A0AAI8VT78_9PEZI|nr:Uu.00g062670.m01.CDS01 [Anthostomella pinea]
MASDYRYTGALEMQHRTRKERRFDETEHDLPDFSGTISPITSVLSTKDKIYDVLSYLGQKNPLPRPVTSEDTVWLLDNTAYRNEKTGKWEAEYVAAAFSQHSSCAVIDAVSAIAKKIELEESDPAYSTIEERLRPFVQDIKPGTQVKALYAGEKAMKLGPGGRNGISSDIQKLPDSKDGALLVPSYAEVPKGANGLLEMKTFYAKPEGWSVISDIDDTIKVTQTSDPIGILRTTFFDTPQVIAGMPELYRYIQSLIKDTSPWFYLSASPYNLYPFLRDFRQRNYPHGTIVLRDSSLMSIPGLLTTLTLGTEDYKVDRMEKINSWLPKRKMICIGDSTQSDPEAYGEVYRKYPNWVKVILIRKVEDIAAIGIEAKNEPERFEKAFKGVPRDVWHVFTNPAECNQIIQQARQKSSKDVPYELLYWPSIPGRGEFVRLALEEAGAEYTDTAHMEKGIDQVLAQISEENTGDFNNPPPLAPPILRHGDLVISQTPNILLYLGSCLGLVPSSEDDSDGVYRVNALALTALDGLSNEVHDCHHPVATSLYYEDQKEEAVKKSKDFVQNRLPKFLGYFERVLQSRASGDGPWLYGGQLTYADLVLFQCIDGTKFAFRKAMAAAEYSGKYVHVFQLYDAVKERPKIQEYLASDRRQDYSMGIYRYYPELDLEDDKVPATTAGVHAVGA